MSTKILLTGADVALRLQICLSLAYRLMRTGELPSVRFGRTVRVREQDLEEFIQRNLKKNGSGSFTLETSDRRVYE